MAVQAEETNPWEDVRPDEEPATATAGPRSKLEKVPTILRPGGRSETNPFKRKPVQSPATVPEAAGISTSSAPPTDGFSELRLGEPESSTNPWKPAIDEPKAPPAPPQIHSVAQTESEDNIWDSGPSQQPSTGPASNSPAVLSLPSEGASPAWDEDELSKPSLPDLPLKSPEEQEFSQDTHAWDDVESRNKGKAPIPQAQGPPVSGEDWNLVDLEPAPGQPSRQSTWGDFDEGEDPRGKSKGKQIEQPLTTEAVTDAPPALPSRRATEVQASPSRAQSPAKKSETYQIKHIHWTDAKAAQNPRKSPILVQNANGPCPLVALVNALTLTTPSNMKETPLVDALKSREQISLDLLLRAVFDELMSPWRSNSEVLLPDPSELYAFLEGLHTGMNVNPRFIPTPELVATHKRTSLAHVHPSERGDLIPGTFENTRDMKFYATFSIPLIHGWLPPKDDSVYESFSRQASSYDDVQALLFTEQELEDKLTGSVALSDHEQQLYEDIMTIKSFLSSSATQLTPWGLQVITKAAQPGTFSILFRNDHFSTLYHHPETTQLLTLVTDAGYHTHDEVVWESLADVNGERAEFFSGDFRLVGGPQQQPSNDVPGAWYDEAGSSHANNQGNLQSVQRQRANDRNDQPQQSPPLSPNHEQEDRDLALALQLQEEEEQRHRAEQEARRRETELSEQFIEQQARGNTARTGPQGRGSSTSVSTLSTRGGRGDSTLAPARTSSAQINVPVREANNNGRGGRPVQQQEIRPLVPPPNTTHRPAAPEEEEAPPTYEQASKATPYVPPTGHPNHPASTPISATSARRQTLPGSRVGRGAGPSAGPSTPARGGRQGMPPPPTTAPGGGVGREKDCIVM
ncbi:uncharacterized protein BCR38DRAFT_350452 [Pseudomassariella vexata]|uniref:MINDY deubiquitinase domain-containing protein n=1 Tax=Pseudomassariella vexata TaxID=1141098 RepID=A0A1Y2DLD5_9PEZI|nr:uncharacterized protein BCR38DRAFT_350452 [Pseudomassariella vexata]ORY60073.1 hypothetical protein BCR38DRAFT_350452 [Pseudomassariella vexata]